MNLFSLLGASFSIASVGSPLFKVGSDIGRDIAIRRTADGLDQNFNYDSLNVYYDLMLLYGDIDKDGKLTRDEADLFRIGSLLPDSNDPTQDPSFRFLGLFPTVDSLYFFCYFTADYSDDSTFNWYLSFQDKIVQNNMLVTDSRAKLMNTYKIDGGGVFYKLKVEGYTPQFNENDHASINIKSIYLRRTNQEVNIEQKSGFNATFDFDRTYFNNNRFFSYFTEGSQKVTGVVDMMLGFTKSEDYTFLWIPTGKQRPLEAQEMAFFFFNFEEEQFNFDVNAITEVSYSYEYLTYEHSQYTKRATSWMNNEETSKTYSVPPGFKQYEFDVPVTEMHYSMFDGGLVGSHKLGVYPGKFTENKPDIDWPDRTKTVSFPVNSRVIKSESRSAKTRAGIELDWNETFLFQSQFGYKSHADYVKNQKVDSLIRMSEVDSKYSGDQYEFFRRFLKLGDHPNYKFAFLVNGDDGSFNKDMWTRKITKDGEYLPGKGDSDRAGSYFYISEIYETVTEAHEPRQLVTLWMSGIKNNGEEFTIWTHNDPANVRYVFAYGMTPPTFGELLLNDISVAMRSFLDWLTKNPWFWWVVGGLIVLLALLLLAFCPWLIPMVIKGVLTVLKFLAWIPYIVVVWPIGKLMGKDMPVWPFK